MKKNVVAAVILGLFFGPCGLIYVGGGQFLMALVVFILVVWLDWDFFLAAWLACPVWSGVAAAIKNSRVPQGPQPAAAPAEVVATVVPAAPPSPSRIRKPGHGDRRCISCGQAVPGHDVVCGNCGCRMEGTSGSESSSKQLAGVGAELELTPEGLHITQVLANGGAAESGLEVGEFILAVEGEDVQKLGFPSALDAIRGPAGSGVMLTVKSATGDTRKVSVVRRMLEG